MVPSARGSQAAVARREISMTYILEMVPVHEVSEVIYLWERAYLDNEKIENWFELIMSTFCNLTTRVRGAWRTVWSAMYQA